MTCLRESRQEQWVRHHRSPPPPQTLQRQAQRLSQVAGRLMPVGHPEDGVEAVDGGGAGRSMKVTWRSRPWHFCGATRETMASRSFLPPYCMLVHKGVFPRIDCNCMQEKSVCKGWEYPLPHYVRCFMFKNVHVGVPRRLFFAAQQRIAITLSPNYYKKNPAFHNEKESRRTWPRCHVSLEKSSKNYSRWENEPNQTSCKCPPPPPAKSKGKYFWRVFQVVIQKPPNLCAIASRHSGLQLLGERAGWSAVWYNSLTGW